MCEDKLRNRRQEHVILKSVNMRQTDIYIFLDWYLLCEPGYSLTEGRESRSVFTRFGK